MLLLRDLLKEVVGDISWSGMKLIGLGEKMRRPLRSCDHVSLTVMVSFISKLFLKPSEADGVIYSWQQLE